MAPLEIIGAGFGRTGTDSLRAALDLLGFKTHHMKSFNQDPSLDEKLFHDAYFDRKNAPWDRMYANYNAAVDWPTAAYWKELHEYYPDAKIILTVRSADSWYKSVNNTIRMFQLSKANTAPDQPGYMKMRMQAVTCMDGKLVTSEFDKEEEMKQIFLDHIEHVKNFVPQDKLLVLELGEGWERLCKFLGKEVPDVPYPHINSNNTIWQRVDKLVRYPWIVQTMIEVIQNKLLVLL